MTIAGWSVDTTMDQTHLITVRGSSGLAFLNPITTNLLAVGMLGLSTNGATIEKKGDDKE